VRVVQRYSAVVTHLDGGLDGCVVLRPPVEALDAVLVFLAVPAQRRFALLLRLRRPAFHFLHRTLKYAIVAESLLYILLGADLGGGVTRVTSHTPLARQLISCYYYA